MELSKEEKLIIRNALRCKLDELEGYARNILTSRHELSKKFYTEICELMEKVQNVQEKFQ